MHAKRPATQNPYFALLSIAWQYAREDRRKYVLVYSMFMISNLATAMYPIIWGLYINAIQVQGADVLRHTFIYGLAYLGVRLLDWSFHGPARLMERELAFSVGRNFLQELYHKALRLPVRWHQDHHSGATINRVRKAYEALRDFFQHGFEYVHTFFKFIFSFAAMIYFAPAFGLVAVLMGFLVVFIIVQFDKGYVRTKEQVNEGEHVVSSTLFDSLSNIITVITLRLEERMETGLLRKVQAILPPFRKNVSINEWKWFVTDMLVGVIYGVIIVGYVWQNWQPGAPFLLGGLVMLVGYVERFTSVFHNVAYLYTDVVRYHTDVKSAYDVLDAYDEYHLPERDQQLPTNWQTIAIQHLNFTHRSFDAGISTDQPQFFAGLKNVDLHLRRGQRIALIGESGSGKSTILALLRGLYPVDPGVKVAVDGEPQMGLETIASHVTLFPQEPEIFENTIEYNITLGLPCEPAELDALCETVHFSEVVAQLPKGLQSNIMEKGVNLSGGQKQRLALARGVFAAKDSDLILLDEPTSSVDPKTESRIYDRMFAAFSDKVVVSALHRLHLLPKFDYIYVFDRGNVIAEGTLEQLLATSPAFRALWQHQEAVMGFAIK